MIELPTNIECDYSGVLADICSDFVSEKRALGYSYNSEALLLSKFSRFSIDFNLSQNTLSEEVVKAWITKKSYEADRNRYARFSLIKMFSEYMQRMGYDAFVPEFDDIGRVQKDFIPYIFTRDEVSRFFTAVDSMQLSPYSSAPRRNHIMPVLFRMLYCCGLRVTEACMLQGSDVDLQEGVLTIRDGKFGRTRYVPMSAELTDKCVEYAKTRFENYQGIDWFFAAPDGGYYARDSIYRIFRMLIRTAGISHGGRGKGPRVHDFRHTFCVHCLQKWIKQGADPTTVLPRLSVYLGHYGFESTERYLRMTSEVYPEITKLMQDKFGYVIPQDGDAQ